MKIILTNDDGIYAPGLKALYDRFIKRHSVTVIAPDRERSAIGHAITLDVPLRARWINGNGLKGYSINGTPADCIKLGLMEIIDFKPDLVISGINPGANAGVNINYSGTVAGARESALYGIASISVSLMGPEPVYFDEAAIFIEQLSRKVRENKLPFGTFLNVNIPNLPLEEIAGVRLTRQRITRLRENFEKRIDPRNQEYYWASLQQPPERRDLEVDVDAIMEDFISITPVTCDATDYKILTSLKEWSLDEAIP
jgi:5'-nucleotidase